MMITMPSDIVVLSNWSNSSWIHFNLMIIMVKGWNMSNGSTAIATLSYIFLTFHSCSCRCATLKILHLVFRLPIYFLAYILEFNILQYRCWIQQVNSCHGHCIVGCINIVYIWACCFSSRLQNKVQFPVYSRWLKIIIVKNLCFFTNINQKRLGQGGCWRIF